MGVCGCLWVSVGGWPQALHHHSCSQTAFPIQGRSLHREFLPDTLYWWHGRIKGRSWTRATLINWEKTKVVSYSSGATDSNGALSLHPTALGLLRFQSIKRGKSSHSGRCAGDQDPWGGSVPSWPIWLGDLIPTCGVGRLGIPSHLRENLCGTDVKPSFASFLAVHFCWATRAQMLEACQNHSIIS